MRMTPRINNESIYCYFKKYNPYKEMVNGDIVDKENEQQWVGFWASEYDDGNVKSEYEDITTGFKMSTGAKTLVTVANLDFKEDDQIRLEGNVYTITKVYDKPLFSQLAGLRKRNIAREYVLVLT